MPRPGKVHKLAGILTDGTDSPHVDGLADLTTSQRDLAELRWAVIDSTEVPPAEKGAVLALRGSVERAEGLVNRIQQERASVDRGIATLVATPA